MAAIAGVLPPAVKVLMASSGRVDPAALLGLALGSEDDIESRRTWHDQEAAHDHDDFDSFVVPLPEIADPVALAARVGALPEQFDVLRVKGFAAVAGKPMRLLVQAVGTRVTQSIRSALARQRSTRRRAGGHRPQGLRPRRGRAHLARVIHAPPDHILHRAGRSGRADRSRPAARRPGGAVVRRQRSRRPRGGLGARSATRCRACGSRTCAICAIPCRSICGSSAWASTPR